MPDVTNLGYGGSVLDASYGAGASAPKRLDFDGVPYVYLPAVAGNYLSVPDAAALDITGDLELQVDFAADDWTPSASRFLLSKRASSTSEYSWLLFLTTTGNLCLLHSATGTAAVSSSATVQSTVPVGLTDGAKKRLKATLDVDNGAGGHDIKYWLSDDGVAWTQLGATITVAGTTSVYSGTAPINIGAADSGATSPAQGKVYRAIVKNGIDGTTVLDANTSVLTSGAQTTFTEQSSNAATVTIDRSTTGRKTVAVVAPVWLLGTNDFMSVPDNPLCDFDADDSFTFLAAIRQWGNPVNNADYLCKVDGVLGYGLNEGGTNLIGGVVNDGTNSASYRQAFTSGAAQVMATVVDRSSQTLSVYYNGVLGGTASTSSVGSLANTADLRIGYDGTQYADFEGMAFAVLRRALTSTEVAAVSSYLQARFP